MDEKKDRPPTPNMWIEGDPFPPSNFRCTRRALPANRQTIGERAKAFNWAWESGMAAGPRDIERKRAKKKR